MAQDIKAREAEDEIAVGLRPIYDRLSEMKAQLDQLRELSVSLIMEVKLTNIVLTHRWTLRETDLYKYVSAF